MAKNRILKDGIYKLVEAKKIGTRLSREEVKKKGIENKVISSVRSFDIHKGNWEEFANWANDNYKVRKLGDIKQEMLKEFLKHKADAGGRDGKGATKKTLQAYISAVNKVMLISGRWKESEKPTLTKWKEDIKIRDDYNQGYKPLTGKEWERENQEKYEKYSQLIETIKGFGLRAKEVDTLTDKSFIIDSKGKMYVQTIGKGGKYRIAESTKASNELMVKLYGEIAQKVDDIDDFIGNKEQDKAKEFLKKTMRAEKNNVKINGVNASRVPKHIFRAEYARTLLSEKCEELKGVKTEYRGYSTIKGQELKTGDLRKYDIQIGAHRGNAEAFRQVSKNLGHNRLDVLLQYL